MVERFYSKAGWGLLVARSLAEFTDSQERLEGEFVLVSRHPGLDPRTSNRSLEGTGSEDELDEIREGFEPLGWSERKRPSQK